MPDFNSELYEEMLLDEGIQYDNEEVAEQLIASLWD